jgi:hypothetical protein
MARAGAARLQWFVDLGLDPALDEKDYDGVLRAIREAGD